MSSGERMVMEDARSGDGRDERDDAPLVAPRGREESGRGNPVAGVGGMTWAVSYGVISIAITLFNKAVMSTYDFQYPALLTTAQGLFTLLSLALLKHYRVISFDDFSWRVAWRVAPLSLMCAFYIIVSLAALGGTNVPMFTALRRTTVLFVVAEEYMYFGKVPSKEIAGSIGVMVLGAIIAASRDLTFDAYSYTLLFLTNLATSLYTVNISVVKKSTNMSVFEILYYNTLVTVPVSCLLGLVMGEFQTAQYFPAWSDGGFLLSFSLSVTLAFFLNLTAYFSTAANSATTQSVIGQLKNFVAFILSLFLFPDYLFEPINFTGLLIGFAGGLWYAYIQWRDRQSSSSKPARPDPVDDEGAKAPSLRPMDVDEETDPRFAESRYVGVRHGHSTVV